MNLTGQIPVLEENLQAAFSASDVPVELRASIERHRANLMQLVKTLQAAGIAEAQIERSVSTIVASYRAELLQAMKLLMKDRP